MDRLEKFFTPFSRMKKADKQALIEHIRKDRTTSKAILKKTTKKQRVNAASKVEAMLAGMSPAEREKFLAMLGG